VMVDIRTRGTDRCLSRGRSFTHILPRAPLTGNVLDTSITGTDHVALSLPFYLFSPSTLCVSVCLSIVSLLVLVLRPLRVSYPLMHEPFSFAAFHFFFPAEQPICIIQKHLDPKRSATICLDIPPIPIPRFQDHIPYYLT